MAGKGGNPREGLVYAALFSAFWSLQIFVDKLALKSGVQDASVYAFQTVVLCAILASIYLFIFRREKVRFSKESLREFSTISVLIGTATIVSIWGLKLSSSINYGFIIKATVVFVPVFAWLFLKEQVSREESVLIAVFLLGIYLLSTGGRSIVPSSGDLLILAAAVLYSATSVYQKRIGGKYSAAEITWVRNTFPLILLFLVPAFLSGPASVLSLEPPLFLLASGVSTFIFVLYLSKALQSTKATYVSMISMLVPVLNTALGYAFLGESFNLIKGIGAAIIIAAGIFLVKMHGK